MEAVARIKFVKMSPQKVRLVANMVKGNGIKQAIDKLRFSDKKMAPIFIKLIESAVNNSNQSAENLKVNRIQVDQAPTMKRFTTRARGGSSRILKRMSHVTVVVSNQ